MVVMTYHIVLLFVFFSSRRRHTRCSRDWSSDVCSSDLCALRLCVVFSFCSLCGARKKCRAEARSDGHCKTVSGRTGQKISGMCFLPHTDGRADHARSEEHTSELQSRLHLVCRLLLEKKQNSHTHTRQHSYAT